MTFVQNVPELTEIEKEEFKKLKEQRRLEKQSKQQVTFINSTSTPRLTTNKNTGFVLAFTKQMPSKDGQLKKQMSLTNGQLSNESGSSDTLKKKVSSRTIITKDSEKIINEELLFFILTRIKNGVDTIDQKDKEIFCDTIKIKLKVKKLMLNDKTRIYKKYDEIFEIVKNNKS